MEQDNCAQGLSPKDQHNAAAGGGPSARAGKGSGWAQQSTVSLGAASLQAGGNDFDQGVCRLILCKLDGISNRSQRVWGWGGGL